MIMVMQMIVRKQNMKLENQENKKSCKNHQTEIWGQNEAQNNTSIQRTAKIKGILTSENRCGSCTPSQC